MNQKTILKKSDKIRIIFKFPLCAYFIHSFINWYSYEYDSYFCSQ